ncbi:hypothetical protein LEMLEM_LOCUS21659 [Lemmus lemmus]
MLPPCSRHLLLCKYDFRFSGYVGFLSKQTKCLEVSFMKQKLQRIVSPLGKFSSHFSVGPACPFHTA